MRRFGLACLFAAGAALGGCGTSSSDSTECPAGQALACSDGACKCGKPCITPSDCSAGEVCACHSLSDDGVCLSQSDADSIGAHGSVTCAAGSCSPPTPVSGQHCADPAQVICGSPPGCCDEGTYACNGNCFATEEGAVHACGSGACQACVANGGTTGDTGSTGTSGGSCTDLTSCLAVTISPDSSGTNCDGYYSASITNNCSQTVEVTLCFAHPDGSCDCGESGINAGQTQAGAFSGWWTCNGTGTGRYVGQDPNDLASCPSFTQCN